MNIDLWKAVTAIGGVIAAVVAVRSYERNTKTKAAQFMLELHKTFFIEEHYKEARAILDCKGADEEKKLAEFVAAESDNFTDFLNFFELVASLRDTGAIENDHMEALLGYYLDKIRAKEAVWAYIRQISHGFENLRRLLSESAAIDL